VSLSPPHDKNRLFAVSLRPAHGKICYFCQPSFWLTSNSRFPVVYVYWSCLKKSLFLFLLLAYAVIFMIEMPNRHLYTSSHILLIDVLHMYELLANLSYGMPHACLLYLCLLSVYLYFIVNSTVLCFFFIRSSQLNYILCGVPNGRRLI
jgi:hypothetical protein